MATRGVAHWARSRPTVVAVVAAALVALIAWLASSDTDFAVEAGPAPSSTLVTATTTTTTVTPSTTTTLSVNRPLPTGDDATVSRVLDGDSFILEDGSRVRLIGVNAPEVEFDECHSAEATDRLRAILPAGTRVRLAYDTERTDRFDRTLAYVYRGNDGLFINLVIVRDGFATEQPMPPNQMHAEEFKRAADEAKTANRGLWRACPPPSTTSTTRPTSTSSSTSTTARSSTTVA